MPGGPPSTTGTSTAAGTGGASSASSTSSPYTTASSRGAATAAVRRARKFLAGHSSPRGISPREKNLPLLQTPSMRRQPTHSGTASATSS